MRLNKMLKSQVRFQPDISPGDLVYFWCDKAPWIGPAPVVKVEDTTVTVLHNGFHKSSDISKDMKHKPQEVIVFDEDISEVSDSAEVENTAQDTDKILRPSTETAMIGTDNPEFPMETGSQSSQLQFEDEDASFNDLPDQDFPWAEKTKDASDDG